MSKLAVVINKGKSSQITISLIVLLFLMIVFIYTSYPDNTLSNIIKHQKELVIHYIQNGMPEKAIKEFDKAIEISYNEGLIKGKEEASKSTTTKIYLKYVIISIIAGLYFSAILVVILWWSDISSQTKSIRKALKINGFIKSIKTKLDPELHEKAIYIAKSKEKLQEIINKENDPELSGVASNILPRLDELTRQALLLIEKQQILNDYTIDIEPEILEEELKKCEKEITKEPDQEVRDALNYQMMQIKNKQNNYIKAKARIRTCEAILKGISARIDSASLDLISLPSIMINKQEFFQRVSVELDEEINLTKKATEALMEEIK